MAKTSTDPIFEAYRRTAPLEDLRVYLRAAERRLAHVELSPSTIVTIAEMAALEQTLTSAPFIPAHKGQVWTIIDRFKASIPGWAGDAGAKDSWCDPFDHPRTYWIGRAELVRCSGWDMTTPPLEGEDVEAEGPVSLDQLAAWYAHVLERVAAFNNRHVPRRAVPLTLDEARAMIAEVPVQAPAVAARVPSTARRPGVLSCPSCQGPLQPAAQAFACAPCRQSYRLTPIVTSTPATRPAARHVDWASAGRKAWETRQRNMAARLAATANTSHLERKSA